MSTTLDQPGRIGELAAQIISLTSGFDWKGNSDVTTTVKLHIEFCGDQEAELKQYTICSRVVGDEERRI